MGILFSCCRGERSTDPERQPLLDNTLTRRKSVLPKDSSIDKAADILAALHTGKLPSQEQIKKALQALLRSSALRDDAAQVVSGGGPLSETGRNVLDDVREIIGAALQIGMEKNDDDKLQDLLFQVSRIEGPPVRVDANVTVDKNNEDVSKIRSQAPSADEFTDDVSDLINSAKDILRILASSAVFRLVLSDLLSAGRGLIAQVAADVGTVAQGVHNAAEDIEKAAKSDQVSVDDLKGKSKKAAAKAGTVAKDTGNDLSSAGGESVNRAKDIFIKRIQEILARAKEDPPSKSALNTILSIFRKYSNKLNKTTEALSHSSSDPPITIEPIIKTSPNLDKATSDLKLLLERLASGHSLDPLLGIFSIIVSDIGSAPDTVSRDQKAYLSRIGEWLDKVLSEPQYIVSSSGTKAAEKLYDDGKALFASETNSKWAQDFGTLLDECNIFITALTTDKATARFINSLDALSSDIADLGKGAAVSGVKAQQKWKDELMKDILGWLVPRIMRGLRSLPMPRVEYQDGTVDVAIDALLLTSSSASASLMPDHFSVQNWSEIQVDMVNSTDHTSVSTSDPRVQTSTKIRVGMDGVRVSAHGIGYYFNYKGFIGYSDEGLLSIDVGGPSSVGQGLTVVVEIETTAEARRAVGEPLFRVLDVKVDVPGLVFSIDQSKHWILNKIILQPLSGSIVRMTLGSILQQQIRDGIEAAERNLSEIVDEAERRSMEHSEEGPSYHDYWTALLEKGPDLFARDNQGGTEVGTHTTATLKGVTRTSITTHPDTGMLASSPATPEESILAVGGAQLFPGKGGPYGVHDRETLEGVARETVGEVQEGIDHAAGEMGWAVDELRDGAVRVREGFERAEVRREEREREERRKGGWRSHAFDLGV